MIKKDIKQLLKHVYDKILDDIGEHINKQTPLVTENIERTIPISSSPPPLFRFITKQN